MCCILHCHDVPDVMMNQYITAANTYLPTVVSGICDIARDHKNDVVYAEFRIYDGFVIIRNLQIRPKMFRPWGILPPSIIASTLPAYKTSIEAYVFKKKTWPALSVLFCIFFIYIANLERLDSELSNVFNSGLVRKNEIIVYAG